MSVLPHFPKRILTVAAALAMAFPTLADGLPDTPSDTPAMDDLKPDQADPPDPSTHKRPAVRKKREPKKADTDGKDKQPDGGAIEVTGHKLTDLQERRKSVAAKLVFGRDELDRYGDSTVGEMLKRLPGVTVAGTPGRGGDIRMRGLGSGYTQILVNGESVPRGFSLDQLAPEQIERIEVIRAPVAEFSAQAIAGTINIVLREEPPKTMTELRTSVGEERGYVAPNVSLLHSAHIGDLSYLFAMSVSRNSLDNQLSTQTYAYDTTGAVTEDQHIRDDNRTQGTGVHMAPRLTYRADAADTITFQPFLSETHRNASGTQDLTEPVGAAPYDSAYYQSQSNSAVARGFGNWLHKFDGGAKLTIKFGAGASHSDSDLNRYQFGGASGAEEDVVNDNHVHGHLGSVGGKWVDPLSDSQTVTAGWDAEWAEQAQTAVFDIDGVSQLKGLGDNLSADTRKLDAYAQDEWNIGEHWSTSGGLRWEGITTRSDTVAGEVNNISSVWTPMVHAVYRLPDSEKDQIRLSVTRSYRAPSLSSLLAVPNLAVINTPTTPDTMGNPNLKPELAWGVDLAYEHYLSQDGILSANIFARSIDNLMRNQTMLEGTRWVSQPYNIGRASTAALELEAKAQLVEFFPHAPAIEFRTNYSRFWSNVDGIPGPNNRLDQQPRQTANVGFDYRAKQWPLTLGANLNWTPAFIVQSSPVQFSSQGNKRVVDTYALWKFTPRTQLRISASNMLHQDYLTSSGFDGEGADQVATTTAQTYTTWTAKLEMKF